MKPILCSCECGREGCASIRRERRKKWQVRHGTAKRWDLGCRCEPCQAAKSKKTRLQKARRFTETAQGQKRGQPWTGAEMEQAMRDDIPLTEIALRLGRTYGAVQAMRTKCSHDPEYRAAVGLRAG